MSCYELTMKVHPLVNAVCFPGFCGAHRGKRRSSRRFPGPLLVIRLILGCLPHKSQPTFNPSKKCLSLSLHRVWNKQISPTMAPQKHVVEVPRNLLPRLTWNSASSRPTVAPSHCPALTKRPTNYSQGWSSFNRQIPTLNARHQSSRAFSTAIRDSHFSSPVSRRLSASTAHPAGEQPLGSPVRHNGVYVAAFKPAQRAFHATPSRPREHHFDTLRFVKRLQAEGFSEEQAVAMMRVLNDIIQESIQNLTRTMVLREGMHPGVRANHA